MGIFKSVKLLMIRVNWSWVIFNSQYFRFRVLSCQVAVVAPAAITIATTIKATNFEVRF